MKRKAPTIPPPPLLLADSWLDGFCESDAVAFAVRRTQAELKAAGITETQVRAIRDELQEVFERWRSENPERFKEPPPMSGLLGNLSPPASHPFESYAAFLGELHAERYAPLTALSLRHGMALAAALLLAEAAAGRFESARQERETMDWVAVELASDRAAEAQKARRTGGKASAAKRKADAASSKTKTLELAHRLRKERRHSRREFAGIIAPKVDRSAAWVRNVLKASGFDEE